MKENVGKRILVQMNPGTPGNYMEWKVLEVAGEMVKVRKQNNVEAWFETKEFDGTKYKVIEVLK